MDDIKDLGSKTSDAASDAAAGASARFGKAKEYVGDKYNAAAQTVKEKYEAASDAVKDKYEEVKTKVDEVDFEEIGGQVRSYVRSNPGKALLISVGIGFVIGLIMRRARDDDED
ncbi:MAG TPA: hypothetical protein VHL58_12405 [Thermoanaerobaculia bacterium]|nr:hypothetical protein [Thermoanaerobaculia bacterium]